MNMQNRAREWVASSSKIVRVTVKTSKTPVLLRFVARFKGTKRKGNGSQCCVYMKYS